MTLLSKKKKQMKSFYQMMKELTKTMKRMNVTGRIPNADEPSYFADFNFLLSNNHFHTPTFPHLTNPPKRGFIHLKFVSLFQVRGKVRRSSTFMT